MLNGTQSENFTHTTVTTTPMTALKRAGRPILMTNGHIPKSTFALAPNSRSKSLQNMTSKIKFIHTGNSNVKSDQGMKRPFKFWFIKGLKQVICMI